MRNSIKILVAVMLILFAGLAGCDEEPVEYAVLLNPSHSNMNNFNSPDLLLTLNQVRQVANYSGLTVVIAAADPLDISYPPGKCPSSEQILSDMNELRRVQIEGKPVDARTKSLDVAPSEDYFWGWGTNHPAAIERIVRNHTSDRPLVIIAITDGISEGYESGLRDALGDLFGAGPTRLAILGMSTAVAGPDQTVGDVWEQAMIDSGASKFDFRTKADSTYYITPTMILPREILETGF